MATTATKSMGELTAKDVTTVRSAFVELLNAGKYDTYLDALAESILTRGDAILGEEKKTPAPKKETAPKTSARLPEAPVATKTKTDDAKTSPVVVNRNYTIPGDKFSGIVVKFLEDAKRAGSGRFEVVVSESDAYPVGKIVVVPVDRVSPTKRGPRK